MILNQTLYFPASENLPYLPFIIGLFPFSSFAIITLFLMFSKGLLSSVESGTAGVPPVLFATENNFWFLSTSGIAANYQIH